MMYKMFVLKEKKNQVTQVYKPVEAHFTSQSKDKCNHFMIFFTHISSMKIF